MIIPVSTNIIIKGLPLMDAEWEVMDESLRTYRRGEIIAVWNEVTIPIQVGDVVLLNKSNFFLILADNEFLVHSSAVFAIEKAE